MYVITKEFAFEAAHQLPEMPDGHQCKRPHGHSYVVVVELESPTLDPFGFVKDFGELTVVKEFIDRELDHRDLRDVFGYHGNTTTAERMARELFVRFRDTLGGYVDHATGKPVVVSFLAAVTVRETAKTSSTYRASYHERTCPASELRA